MRRGAGVLKLWCVCNLLRTGKDCEMATCAYTEKEGDRRNERRPEGMCGYKCRGAVGLDRGG